MTGYQNTFGQATVPSAGFPYQHLTLTSNTALNWPYNYAGQGSVVSKIMDVTCSAAVTLSLPDATQVSVGIYAGAPATYYAPAAQVRPRFVTGPGYYGPPPLYIESGRRAHHGWREEQWRRAEWQRREEWRRQQWRREHWQHEHGRHHERNWSR